MNYRRVTLIGQQIKQTYPHNDCIDIKINNSTKPNLASGEVNYTGVNLTFVLID